MDGKRTRWKTVLRADSLDKLSPASQEYLIEYGVRTIIDLRRTTQILERPNVFAGSSQVRYTHQNLVGDISLEEMAKTSAAIRAALTRWESLADTEKRTANYCMRLDFRSAQIGETLATLAVPGVLPALYHCSGGKDRTGLITALVLGLAGVPAETIVEDYAMSARCLLPRYLKEQAPPEIAASGMTWQEYAEVICPPDAMRGTLRHLDERYGGIEAYVREAGLTREQIARLRSAVVG